MEQIVKTRSASGRPETARQAPAAESTSTTEPTAAGKRIVVIADGGPLSWMTVNALTDKFGPLSVLLETPEPRSLFIRRRLRILGPVEVAGQIAFSFANKLVKRRGRERVRQIVEEAALRPFKADNVGARRIASVNSKQCRDILKALNPDVVLVHGTRIIKRKTLQAISAPFINFHAGINPKYRGQHGAYWARAAGDDEHAGVTVHLIDEGVDTGQVLYQARVHATRADNISTYQYLQTATAIPLIAKAAEDALAGRLRPRTVDLPSKQWFHPTLWGYLYTGLKRGVW